MLLTIFTPTYNRKNKIGRLYDSLKNQTNKSFEWLIIDDGSNDGTDKLIQNYIKEREIDIKYVRQDNGGKHVAYNTALNYVKGKYFFCVDSDDWISDEFVKELSNKSEDKDYEGFIAYKSNSKNELLSKMFPPKIEKCSILDLSKTYHCEGEFSIIIRSDIARNYKFPVFKNEKFIGENVIYDRISEKYRFKLINKIATICEYQEDGLTNNYTDLMKQNPSGFCLYYMQRIDLVNSFIEKVSMAGKYNCFKRICNNQNIKYCGKNSALVYCTKPLGWLFWGYYKVKRGF